MTADPADLVYVVSITDGCIDCQQTEDCMLEMHKKLNTVLMNR